ncbi:MAG: hypothetical protein IPG97_17185 [Microthrixaceae bacterium]|nr:hypothetical protein [Microthrixaceae bacterium]
MAGDQTSRGRRFADDDLDRAGPRPHGYTANISHEMIYQGVYAPKRHGPPTKVYKMLHRRRPRRRHTGQRHSQQRSSVLGQFNIIHNRPPAAEARAEVGHPEGDGSSAPRNQSAIITLVDRKTRYPWLARHDTPNCAYTALSTQTPSPPPSKRSHLS